jgi:hypothetical protein
MAYLPTGFHKNLQIGFKVIGGGGTDRQAGDLINLLFIFGK